MKGGTLFRAILAAMAAHNVDPTLPIRNATVVRCSITLNGIRSDVNERR